MRLRTLLLGVIAPLCVVAAAAFGVKVMIDSRPIAVSKPPVVVPPTVRVAVVTTAPRRIDVHASGTVVPRTQTRLSAEVAGRVLSISPSLRSGGFFEAGETLVEIDPIDQELALQKAHAEVAKADRMLAWELAEADASRREWTATNGTEPPPLVARAPQVAEAKANLAAQVAARAQAQRDLDRCTVKAPYAGRARTKSVDVGDYVQRGTELAHVFAVDAAEIRLPIADTEFEFLDVGLDYRGDPRTERRTGPKVTLRARFGGRVHAYEGVLVRTESELDARTRMVTAVVEVEDPYARSGDAQRPPLAAGMYVDATIHGRTFDAVVTLPRTVLRGASSVHVVDAEDRLRFRDVDVLHTDRDTVTIAKGLAAGERVCLNRVEAASDGMRVTVVDRAPGEPNGAPSNGGR